MCVCDKVLFNWLLSQEEVQGSRVKKKGKTNCSVKLLELSQFQKFCGTIQLYDDPIKLSPHKYPRWLQFRLSEMFAYSFLISSLCYWNRKIENILQETHCLDNHFRWKFHSSNRWIFSFISNFVRFFWMKKKLSQLPHCIISNQTHHLSILFYQMRCAKSFTSIRI